jgi:hypothetical protein
MKNIHLIPTDKPSRLYYNGTSYKDPNSTMAMDWFISSAGYKPQNIYITSDEEIKDGDWCLDEENNIIFQFKYFNSGVLHSDNHSQFESKCKKIILTTDQDLIKYGVQAIDDEFLEWFVKNPSCEELEIEIDSYMDKNISESEIFTDYKIIISKKEPKYIMGIDPYDNIETLEEAAHKMLNDYGIKSMGQSIGVLEVKKLMVKMTKWQQERSYSEEIIDILDNVRYWETCPNSYKVIIERFIEQFKNK